MAGTNLQELKDDLFIWLGRYLYINEKVRSSSTLTPYIHILVYHIPELLRISGNLRQFNCESLEKLNEFTTKYFQSSTNKQNKIYIRQLISKRQRIEFINLKGPLTDFHELESDDDDKSFRPDEDENISSTDYDEDDVESEEDD